MQLDASEVRRRCAAHGVPLSRLLRQAGVSRTAYYSLARRRSVLPRTVQRLAEALDVPPSALLSEQDTERRRAARRIREARRIVQANRGVSFENVWHTLILLEEPPLDRLERALRRGRARTP